jgi:ABC-type multidrug transport system ATPase subunit
MQADFVQSDGLAWKDIVYDIPIKSKRKAKGSTSPTGSEAEKAEHVTPTPVQSPHVDPPAPGTRRILSGISGSVPQGSYVGLLGASGAGKTTLLNILSARLSKVGTLKGAVTYGGLERNPGSWKRTVGYVEQDDIMLPQHTVRETIEVAARLRLPNKEVSRAEKMQRVEETIDMLRLEGCEGSRIGGGTTRGVSGGERKRTSIAVVCQFIVPHGIQLMYRN